MDLRADASAEAARWPAWQRVGFRFVFVYFILYIAPWTWVGEIPGLGFVASLDARVTDWAVQLANAHVFHVRDPLVLPNGSGDTSWSWARLWLYLSIAALAAVAWTLWDRRRLAYPRLLYWLRTILRYYIAIAALRYGIIKVFPMQMPFPNLSALSTTLGDLLPMRLSWHFIGYSVPYEMFSGAVETIAGLLLLWRRAVTLGLIAAAGAFVNVVMINLAYDVPVKLYAMHLLAVCLFLLALDGRRLLGFLLLNRGAPATSAWEPPFSARWQRYARLALKATFVVLFLIMPFGATADNFRAQRNAPPARPFRAGVYDVRLFVLGGDTLPPLSTDTVRWRDVVFDNAVQGSVGTTDSVFWQRYRRGHFRYRADTTARTVAVWKTSTIPGDSTFLFTMRYAMPDTNTIQFWSVLRGDSLRVELARSRRHFQLAERQFHWLSEYNR